MKKKNQFIVTLEQITGLEFTDDEIRLIVSAQKAIQQDARKSALEEVKGMIDKQCFRQDETSGALAAISIIDFLLTQPLKEKE